MPMIGLCLLAALVCCVGAPARAQTATATTATATTAAPAPPVSAAASPKPKVETAEPDRLLFFVGGTKGKPDGTLDRLSARLADVDAPNTYVVFTGNYTKKGEMPGKNSKKRARAEEDVLVHVDAVRDFHRRGGQVYFLPGHLDFGKKGRKGVRRLDKFLNRALHGDGDSDEEDQADVMPVADCGEPEVIELGRVGVLALLNSAWWMQDFTDHARTNEGCAFQERGQYRTAYEGVAKKYRTKRVFIAQHHPIVSNGPYGGGFGWRDHLVPPVIGSMIVLSKYLGLVPEYQGHVLYNSLASQQKDVADKYGRFVFASGHDRSLQVVAYDNQLQLVAGSSGKPGRVVGADGGSYSEARTGWIEVEIDGAGEGRVRAIAGDTGEVRFERALPEIPVLNDGALPPAPPIEAATATATYCKRDPGSASFLWRALLGDHYREAYRLQLEFPVLDLSKEQGGLTPVKIGGGNQTNSLRLVDGRGGQWALRSTAKDSSRYLPYPMNKVSFINYLLEDGFTAVHPGAAVAVSKMAAAIGIYHTRPRLMYLPDQAGLAEYRGYITDETVLLERRPKTPKQGEMPAHLGGGDSPVGKTKYKSTDDMLDRIQAKPWKHVVDQESMLRARLLDIFLGDWDRHRDQWRFARLTQEDGTKLYRPIPRDRDQAWGHYDGALLTIARMASPNIRVLQPFRDEITSLDWLTYNARHIDIRLLNEIEPERWMQIAGEVQAALSDEVIDDSLAQIDPKALELDGAELRRKLIGRRDSLLDAAERFYAKVNKNPEVLGSAKRDLITVEYLDGGRVRVEARRAKKGPESEPYFARTYDAEVTDSVTIYALAGKDELEVSGAPHDDITVRFLGGAGDDVVRGAGAEHVDAGDLEVYDRKKGLEIDESVDVDDERGSDGYTNQYYRFDHHREPLKFGGLPWFQIDPDNGLYVGGSVNVTTSAFKRRPFAASHALRAFFATTTLGVDAGYRGVFPNSFGDIHQIVEVDGRTPQAARNFFGFTNRYTPFGAEGRDFYRVRQAQANLRYGLEQSLLSNAVRLGLQVHGSYVDVEDTEGRFVVMSPDVEPEAFDGRLFAGATLYAQLSTIDSALYPRRGIGIEATATMRSDVTPGRDGRTGSFGFFTGAVVTHIPFDRGQRFVLSSRARVQGIVGDHPFYFAPSVGAGDLRAYNRDQLVGDAVFSHSTDLRVELLRFGSNLPSVLGVAASIDHGLAFGAKARGGDYHAMAGGTVFWNIIDMVGLGVSYHRSFDEGQRVTVSLGPLFARTGFVVQ